MFCELFVGGPPIWTRIKTHADENVDYVHDDDDKM